MRILFFILISFFVIQINLNTSGHYLFSAAKICFANNELTTNNSDDDTGSAPDDDGTGPSPDGDGTGPEPDRRPAVE